MKYLPGRTYFCDPRIRRKHVRVDGFRVFIATAQHQIVDIFVFRSPETRRDVTLLVSSSF